MQTKAQNAPIGQLLTPVLSQDGSSETASSAVKENATISLYNPQVCRE